jgi:osmotically-inducible protein OsmY
VKLFKILALSLALGVMGGCTSFIANNTSNTVGTPSGERTLGQVILDSSIERTARINMYKLDSRFKQQSRVDIESFHSVVLLTGQVPDAQLKKLAEDNVKAMSDVKAVHNFISIGPQISYSTIVQDLAVTANTKGLIMREPVIKESKVRLHTEDGVLYVMGRLNNAEVSSLNTALAKVGNVTKIITLIDNIEQNQAMNTATTSVGLGANLNANSSNDPTPVAVDPNQEQPQAEAIYNPEASASK